MHASCKKKLIIIIININKNLKKKTKAISCKHNFQNHPQCQKALKHRRSWEGTALESNVTRHGVRHLTRLPVRQCSIWAFFIFFLNSHRLDFDSHRIGLVQPESSCIGRRPKRLKQAKMGLESCRNSRNQLGMKPKHPKSLLPQFYSKYLLLLLCFLFCFVFCFVFLAFFFLCFVNQGHSNVFFKNILIVKIYRKYK